MNQGVYRGLKSREYYLEKQIGKGGEGAIFSIKGNSSQVAKIFDKEKRSNEREQKIKYMSEMKLEAIHYRQITWPIDVLYDESGFAGYTMQRLSTTENLNNAFTKSQKQLGLKERFVIAYNICAAVDAVHEIGQVCGDLNPQNICVDLSGSDKYVTLVDTDSYHITDGNTVYRCEVGMPNYLAPEIQIKLSYGENLKETSLPTFTKETDLFAVAVHIFTLLMNGCNPFSCATDTGQQVKGSPNQLNGENIESVVLPQPVDNIVEGFSPFFMKKKGITTPLYAPDINSLPGELVTLFKQTFIAGYKEPKIRTSLSDWAEAIRTVNSRYQIVRCKNGHEYFSTTSLCPYCEVEKRIKASLGMDIPEIPDEEDEKYDWGDEEEKIKTTNAANDNKNKSDAPFWLKWMPVYVFVSVIIVIALSNHDNRNNDSYNSASSSYEYSYEEEESSSEESVVSSSASSSEEEEEVIVEDEAGLVSYLQSIKSTIESGDYDGAKNLISSFNKSDYGTERGYFIIQNNKLKADTTEVNDSEEVIYLNNVSKYFYCGGWKDGKPNGAGVKLISDTHRGCCVVHGSYANGKENGYCEVYYAEDKDANGNEFHSTYRGNYTDGLENGEIIWIIDVYNGDTSNNGTFTLSSVNGTRQVIREEDGGKIVFAESDTMYWSCTDASALEGHYIPGRDFDYYYYH